MRIEILLFLIAGFIMANIYTDGKYMKLVLSWKKYYQMAGVAFAAFVLYILIKRNPARTKDIIVTTNDYIKYLPLDKNSSNIISPLLDFTAKSYGAAGNGYSGGYEPGNAYRPEAPILQKPHNGATKRSVSESKKKFVASRQNWRCSACNEQLPASYEVDHIKRLEYGGDNHIDNLRAMCRNCHGQKTLIENL